MKLMNFDGSSRALDRFLTYDDVLLVPQRSEVASRSDVDLTVRLGRADGPGVTLEVPILSANMDTVTGEAAVKAMGEAGGLGVLHRFLSVDEQAAILGRLREAGSWPYAFSIGVGGDRIERLERSVEAGGGDFSRLAVCVDVAHGHMTQVLDTVREARDRFPELVIIAGNVATGLGAADLVEAGADIIKVGVGPGSMCTTRLVTGFGVPQLSAVAWAVDAVQGRASVVADGGIRTSGDGVKALAAGADALMLGRYLASAEEAPGQTFVAPSGKSKVYRGMASRAAQVDWKGGIPAGLAPEGEDTVIAVTGTMADLVGTFAGGLRSGFAYAGAPTLTALRERAVFIEASAATPAENRPHGK